MWKGKGVWESSLEEVLRELDIFSLEDYERLVPQWTAVENRTHGGQEKIDALRLAVTEYYYNFTRNRLLSGQFISVIPAEIRPGLNIENYMCLFPKRTMVETTSLCSFVDLSMQNGGNYDMPPDDFYRQYFRYKRLIDVDIAHLYPVNDQFDSNDGAKAIVDSSNIIRLKNVAHVSQKGQFSKVIQRANIFYLAFPWLYNADTETYLDICSCYPAEFENLANTIEKLALASNDGSDFQDAALKDLKDALTNIQVAFDKKRLSLKSKGIPAVLGIALTCIPYALSNFFTNFNPDLFRTIIGGASLFSSTTLLNSFYNLKYESIENPFWVIWEWRRRTPTL